MLMSVLNACIFTTYQQFDCFEIYMYIIYISCNYWYSIHMCNTYILCSCCHVVTVLRWSFRQSDIFCKKLGNLAKSRGYRTQAMLWVQLFITLMLWLCYQKVYVSHQFLLPLMCADCQSKTKHLFLAGSKCLPGMIIPGISATFL